MQELASKREVKSKVGMQTTDVVLVGALLAAGAVLRLFTPPVFGITPNFVIVMYCLAVYLIKPRLAEAIGIGLVAAAVCSITTKSIIPYINFISEPIGILVVFALVKAPFKLSLKKYSFKPSVVTFLGTISSGFVYINVLKLLILFTPVSKNPAYTMLLFVVITTAIANTIIAQLVYYPIKQALRKKD